MKKIVLILILMSFMACQESEKSVDSPVVIQLGAQAGEISSLIADNNRLQSDLAENIIMTTTTQDQESLFREFLIRSRRSLIALLDNPKSKKALKQLENLVFKAKALPLTVKDQSFVTPYLNQLEQLIEDLYLVQGGVAENYLIKFPFDKLNAASLIRVKDETAADFSSQSNDDGGYLGVNSFSTKSFGSTSIITPVVSIDALKYAVRFEYLVGFYSADARKQNLIKFYVGVDKADVSLIEWQDLNLEIAPNAPNFTDSTLSKNIALNFSNSNIRFKVEYTSMLEEKFFPALNLYKLEVVEIK
jgi:hypothetical protein